MRTVQKFTGALVLAGVLTAGAGAGVASASEPRNSSSPSSTTIKKTERTADVATARARCSAAIDERIAQITRWGDKAAASTMVTDAHKAALATNVAATIAQLQAIKTSLAGITDIAALKTACAAVNPLAKSQLLQLQLVLGFDGASAALTRLTDALGALPATPVAPVAPASIDARSSKGEHDHDDDDEHTPPTVADVQAQLDAAQALIDGAADEVLALPIPSDRDAYRPFQKDLKAAVKHLRKASHMIHEITDDDHA